MISFLVSFPFLLLLCLSFCLRPAGSRLGPVLLAFLVAYQFYFIGLLGVGLIQEHLDCPSLLGDCYVRSYPPRLDDIKLLLGIWGCLWVAAAVYQSGRNLLGRWRVIRHG